MKILLATLMLALAGTASATEDNASVVLSADTKLVERGVVLSNNTTVGLDLRFDDLLFDGVFARAEFDSFGSLTPLNDGLRSRTDLSAGYAGTFGGASTWEASIARRLNPLNASSDYTEARARVKSGLFFAEAAQGMTTGVQKDTYLAVGAEQAFGDFTAGVLASTVRYNEDGVGIRDEFAFNNAQAYVKWNAWRNLDVQANYSYGSAGRDRFGDKLDNIFWGGVSYRF